MYVVVIDWDGDLKAVGRRTKKGLHKPFRSESEAEDAIRHLPEDLASKAVVLELESVNSIY